MTSRREEKERRREEREAAEEAARRAQARRMRLVQLGIAGALLAAVVVGVVLALSGGGSGGSGAQADAGTALPARKVTDLRAAVRASGCTYRTFRSEGRRHIDPGGTYDRYRTNPPTSGPHDPVPAQDGVYVAGNTPRKEALVHSLEHGRIELQYRPGTPATQVRRLEALFDEPNKGQPGYHEILVQNMTGMRFQAAAVAWTAYVGCDRITDGTWDAFRAFRDRYTDQGPELIP